MKRRRTEIVLLILLLVPSAAAAQEFGLDATVLGQVRRNARMQREVPVNDYLGLTLAFPDVHFSAEGDMRQFRDFARKINDFDLYQTVLHVSPVEALRLDFGRQFIDQGFTVEAVDGLSVAIMPPGPVEVAVYSGIPRSVEIGDFNRNDGLLAGFTVALKDVPRAQGALHAAWRRDDMRGKVRATNDDMKVGADGSYQFGTIVRPKLYGLFEYSIGGRQVEAATGGLDIFPHERVSLNLEGNYFNANRKLARQTVLTLLTAGRTISGRLATRAVLVPEWLDFVAGYSYQRLTTHPGVRRNGHLLDAGLRFMADAIGLTVEPSYFFTKSYGGKLNGARLNLHERFTKKISATAWLDFAKYSKVTGSRDSAITAAIWSGYEVIRGLKLSAGFEYNRNSAFTRDIRGSFELAYHFDHRS